MGPCVLLADDDADIRFVYSTALRADGIEVVEAGDGDEALDRVAALRPALLLLDLWMPRVNGFEVLDRMLRDPALSASTRVVILSSLSDADSSLESYSSGAFDYWVKGLPLDDLRSRVRRLLAMPEAG